MHVSAETYVLCKGFVQEMRKLWIGEVEFRGELNERQLVEFIFLLRQLEENNESNYLLLKKQLAERGITNIDVGKLEGFKDGLTFIDSDTLRRQSKEIYFTTIELVKDLMGDPENQSVVQIRRAKRLMLKTVDVLMKDESALLGLTNIKSYDDYTFTHSVNVAIYAIALGQRLGIPKKHLNYLGMAGLFHDIGKTGIDKDLMNKSGSLSPEEWEIIKTHPLRGAELVMKARGWGELSTRMMAVSFEHHLG